ncbi:MAG TPA: hypothetical protein VEQ85_03945 [Lacipirellulaceae bacterium]|nr:hypothetical protein [Lacipirellulaceae bacterium]
MAATLGSPANGAIIFSDNLSAADGPLAGTVADVGGAWTATASAATPIQIVSGTAAVKTSGQDDYAAFSSSAATTAGASIATSLDINVTAAQANGDYFAHLSSPLATTSAFFQRLFARSTTGGYVLGLVDTSGTGSTITYGTTVLSFNTTYDVDIVWSFVAGANNDTFALTVNSTPYLTHNWTSVTAEPATLEAANLRQGSAGNAPTVNVDNLVVDYAPVPEPGAVGLLLSAMLGLVRLRSRS